MELSFNKTITRVSTRASHWVSRTLMKRFTQKNGMGVELVESVYPMKIVIMVVMIVGQPDEPFF